MFKYNHIGTHATKKQKRQLCKRGTFEIAKISRHTNQLESQTNYSYDNLLYNVYNSMINVEDIH